MQCRSKLKQKGWPTSRIRKRLYGNNECIQNNNSCDTVLEGTTEENEEATTSTNGLIDDGVNSPYLLESSALDADTSEPL